jgi:TonB family protein
MKTLGWALVCAAFVSSAAIAQANGGAGAAPSAPTSSPAPAATAPKIANPDWVRRPNGDDFVRVYPPNALQRGIEGHATMECEVAADGYLRKCRILEETPKGYGFGAALLLLAPRFQMKPMTIDGRPVAGARVRIPVGFKVRGGGYAQAADEKRPLRSWEHVLLARPVWEAAPSVADVAAARPPAPVEGHVVLQCLFTSKRTLTRCEKVQESPPGKGFAKAAIALAAKFRAQLLGDRPKEGDGVQFTVAFDAPGVEPDISNAALKWNQLPDADELRSLFPAAARAAKVTMGRVQLDCMAGADGALSDCRVAAEDPSGLGFGDAALKLALEFRFNPWTDDGRPIGGRRIILPLRFIDDTQAPTK